MTDITILSGHNDGSQVFREYGLTIVTEPYSENTVRVTVYRDSDNTILSQEIYGN